MQDLKDIVSSVFADSWCSLHESLNNARVLKLDGFYQSVYIPDLYSMKQGNLVCDGVCLLDDPWGSEVISRVVLLIVCGACA